MKNIPTDSVSQQGTARSTFDPNSKPPSSNYLHRSTDASPLGKSFSPWAITSEISKSYKSSELKSKLSRSLPDYSKLRKNIAAGIPTEYNIDSRNQIAYYSSSADEKEDDANERQSGSGKHEAVKGNESEKATKDISRPRSISIAKDLNRTTNNESKNLHGLNDGDRGLESGRSGGAKANKSPPDKKASADISGSSSGSGDMYNDDETTKKGEMAAGEVNMPSPHIWGPPNIDETSTELSEGFVQSFAKKSRSKKQRHSTTKSTPRSPTRSIKNISRKASEKDIEADTTSKIGNPSRPRSHSTSSETTSQPSSPAPRRHKPSPGPIRRLSTSLGLLGKESTEPANLIIEVPEPEKLSKLLVKHMRVSELSKNDLETIVSTSEHTPNCSPGIPRSDLKGTAGVRPHTSQDDFELGLKSSGSDLRMKRSTSDLNRVTVVSQITSGNVEETDQTTLEEPKSSPANGPASSQKDGSLNSSSETSRSEFSENSLRRSHRVSASLQWLASRTGSGDRSPRKARMNIILHFHGGGFVAGRFYFR